MEMSSDKIPGGFKEDWRKESVVKSREMGGSWRAIWG